MTIKKLTIEEVKAEFEAKGWHLLSDEYVDVNTPVNAICKNNHKHKISLTGMRTSKSTHGGCGQCAGNIKFDIEKARDVFKNNGMTLTEDEYENNSTPMSFVC